MTAYYNEIDPKAAAWLRELIKAGHIAPGEVDERSIVDIRPSELAGFVQCHFFAGIGVWSYALRRAGWPDNRPVWTGSCPCPPFSTAGKGQQCPACGSKRNLCHPRKTGHFICLSCGCDRFADARHLWPEFSRLICECRPSSIFGEQVASADGRLWLDVVSACLRLSSYGFAAADLCSAGVGSPNIRQRLWWFARRGVRLADAYRRQGLEGQDTRALGHKRAAAERGGRLGGLAKPDGRECDRKPDGEGCDCDWTQTGRLKGNCQPECSRTIGGMADTDGWNASPERQPRGGQQRLQSQDGGVVLDGRPGPTNGLWRAADWLFCRDGKWRPVEPGTFPLAHGAPARVGRLRGYGNAINAEAAVAFIEAAAAHEILDLEAA